MQKTEVNSNRIEWIDCARGFAICMIVLAHVIQYFPCMEDVNLYICSFHVSIFFVLSGMLAYVRRDKPPSCNVVIRSRVESLLTPYIIFSIINFLIKFVVLSISGQYTIELLEAELIELLITGNGTVWFLMTLFLVEILYTFMSTYIRNKYIPFAVASILCSTVFLLESYHNPILVVAKRVFVALFFYYVGYWAMRLKEKTLWMLEKGVVISLLCLIPGYILWNIYDVGISYFPAEFSHLIPSVCMNVFTSLGWIFMVEALTKHCKVTNHVLGFFGRNSLIIMLIHPILLMSYVYPIGFPIESLSSLGEMMFSLLFFGILMLIQIPIIWIINKYFPWMIGKKKRYD